MERKIVIMFEKLSVEAVLNDSATSNKIWSALPIESSSNTWGEEIYFSMPVHYVEENAKSVVDIGDLGYWPPGNAMCLFFGLTPISVEGEIKPASPVNIVGKLTGEIEGLKSIKSGDVVSIRRFDQE